MSIMNKDKIRKYAEVLWVVCLAAIFAACYLACFFILSLFGMNSEIIRNAAVTVGAFSTFVTYIALVFWGLKNL